ncbi:MAG: Sulfur carrier protein ThiS [Candidatus Erwinia impunctatus]
MIITLNDELTELTAPVTVQALLDQLHTRQDGCALAINQVIIPQAAWADHLLRDGDNILLFQAIAGG